MAATIKRVPGFPEGDGADEVFALIEKESDRGCILVVGAWLDELLGELLQASLLRHEPTLKALFSEPNAPFGTFSARINVAHGFGLIAEDEWRSLHKIRALRNAAAHFEKNKKARGFIDGFSDNSVAADVRAIALLDERIVRAVTNADATRWLFNIAGSVLIGRLMGRMRKAKPPGPQANTDWASYWNDFIEKNKEPDEVVV